MASITADKVGAPLLPAALLKKPEDVWYHNWLYSVVPASVGDTYLYPFLSGYCKNCRKAFTIRLNVDESPGYYSEMELDIPREGCSPPPL